MMLQVAIIVMIDDMEVLVMDLNPIQDKVRLTQFSTKAG